MWLSRARAFFAITRGSYRGRGQFSSCFSGWNHSANAAPSITIRLNMPTTPLFKHSIRLDILANTSSDHSIRLETLAPHPPNYPFNLNILTNAAPNHPIRFGVPAMDEKLPQRGFTFDSPGLPTIGGYLGNDASKNATPLGVVLSFCSNQTAFIGVDHANKKGGYLLSRIALFDKVYHRTN